MTKAPTADERRAARQAQLIKEARVRAEQAKDDAAMNLPVFKAAMKDVEALGKLAETLAGHAAQVLVTSDGAATWNGQVETLAVLQGNLKTIGEALIAHATAIVEAPAA